MSETLLIQVYNFLRQCGLFDEEATLDWVSRLNRLHSRGWLYGSYLRDELLAVAGAFRIPSWDEKYLTEIPDHESGKILFISFFAAIPSHSTAPLKLLRQHLRRYPQIREIIYFKKNWRPGKPLYELERRRLIIQETRKSPNDYSVRLGSPRRLWIQPPELFPLTEKRLVSVV